MIQKRDMYLIKLLLLDCTGEVVDFSKYVAEQIDYHVYLLINAKWVEGEISKEADGYGGVVFSDASISCITEKGQQFLNVAKNEGAWQAVHKILIEKAMTVSADVLQIMLHRQVQLQAD